MQRNDSMVMERGISRFPVRGKGVESTIVSALVRALVIFLMAVMVAGCSQFEFGATDATLGEQVVLTGVVEFFISSGFDGYFVVPEKGYPLMLADPVWTTPEGVSLADKPILNLTPTSVSWTEGNTTYSVKGMKLTANLNAKVASDAKPGKNSVYLELPGIAAVAAALGGSPSLAARAPLPNRIEMAKLMIHPSATSKWTALFWKVALVILGIVIVIAILSLRD